jgi:ABC-type uncharacterized transport system permease subunit
MEPRVSVFQITIFFLYLCAALAFAASRLLQGPGLSRLLAPLAFVLAGAGVLIHGELLWSSIVVGNSITLSYALSLIGVQLGLTAFLGAFVPSLRGVSAGLLLLAAAMGLAAGTGEVPLQGHANDWQMRTHILTSMFAYGLLTVGAIVAMFGLVQLKRLKGGRLTPANRLFAPLDTTETLLFLVTFAGFTVLALSVISGFTFVDNLFAQHLVHKTVLSLLALLLFGILLVGRQFAGWRGERAIYLYLAGFALLVLAYFGTRFILEQLLGRSWS